MMIKATQLILIVILIVLTSCTESSTEGILLNEIPEEEEIVEPFEIKEEVEEKQVEEPSIEKIIPREGKIVNEIEEYLDVVNIDDNLDKIFIKDNDFNGKVVIPDAYAATNENAWRLLLPHLFSYVSKQYEYPDEFATPFYINCYEIGCMYFSEEIEDIFETNLILIGSPCDFPQMQTILGDLFDENFCQMSIYKGIPKNTGLVALVKKNNRFFLLLTGYGPEDIERIAQGFRTYYIKNAAGRLNATSKKKVQLTTDRPPHYNQGLELIISDYLEVGETKVFQTQGQLYFVKFVSLVDDRVTLEINDEQKEITSRKKQVQLPSYFNESVARVNKFQLYIRKKYVNESFFSFEIRGVI